MKEFHQVFKVIVDEEIRKFIAKYHGKSEKDVTEADIQAYVSNECKLYTKSILETEGLINQYGTSSVYGFNFHKNTDFPIGQTVKIRFMIVDSNGNEKCTGTCTVKNASNDFSITNLVVESGTFEYTINESSGSAAMSSNVVDIYSEVPLNCQFNYGIL